VTNILKKTCSKTVSQDHFIGIGFRKKNMDDYLIQRVASMVNYIRHRPEQPGLELEARVGKFVPGDFQAGYDSKFKDIILRMINRLNRSAEHSTYWKAEKQYAMQRFNYANGVRKTCVPRAKQMDTTYTLKQRVDEGINLRCNNREYDARISLSNETPITTDTPEGKAMIQALKKTKVESVRLLHRASFVHTVPPESYVVTKNPSVVTKPIQFQFDISKVSTAGHNKLNSSQGPVFYHCEVELLNRQNLTPLQDAEEERKQDQFIAQYLIQCLRSLLGTTQRIRKNPNSSEVSYRQLPEATFSILGSNI